MSSRDFENGRSRGNLFSSRRRDRSLPYFRAGSHPLAVTARHTSSATPDLQPSHLLRHTSAVTEWGRFPAGRGTRHAGDACTRQQRPPIVCVRWARPTRGGRVCQPATLLPRVGPDRARSVRRAREGGRSAGRDYDVVRGQPSVSYLDGRCSMLFFRSIDAARSGRASGTFSCARCGAAHPSSCRGSILDRAGRGRARGECAT